MHACVGLARKRGKRWRPLGPNAVLLGKTRGKIYTHLVHNFFVSYFTCENAFFDAPPQKARKIRGFFILRFSRVPGAPDTWFTREKTVFSNTETSARPIFIEKIRVKIDFLREDRKACNLSGFSAPLRRGKCSIFEKSFVIYKSKPDFLICPCAPLWVDKFVCVFVCLYVCVGGTWGSKAS